MKQLYLLKKGKTHIMSDDTKLQLVVKPYFL